MKMLMSMQPLEALGEEPQRSRRKKPGKLFGSSRGSEIQKCGAD